MDLLDRKVIDNFPGMIVRKDLSSIMKKGANVPTYVLEYLLGQQCSSEDEDVVAAISAAVMMMYEGTGKTPVIRSIRPANKGVRSAWGMAGVMNNTRPF